MNQTCTTSSCGNGRGICMITYCSCFTGFYGNNCEETLENIYPQAWIFGRIFLTLGYLALTILWGLAIYRYWFSRKKDSGFLSRNALWIQICYFTYDLGQSLVYAIDPFGAKTYPWAVNFWNAYAAMMGFFFLGLILSFWIETFYSFEQYAKKIEQLKKIRKDFDPEISLRDLEITLSKMNRFRIPYIVALSIIGLYQFPLVISSILYLPTYQVFEIIDLILNIILYFVYCIAFMIYERRLTTLVESLSAKKEIRNISLKVRFFCIVSICSIAIYTAWIIIFTGPLSDIVYRFFMSIQQWIVTVVVWSIYVKISWRKFSIKRIVYVTESGTSNDSHVSVPVEYVKQNPL